MPEGIQEESWYCWLRDGDPPNLTPVQVAIFGTKADVLEKLDSPPLGPADRWHLMGVFPDEKFQQIGAVGQVIDYRKPPATEPPKPPEEQAPAETGCGHVNFVVPAVVQKYAATEGGPILRYDLIVSVICKDCGQEFELAQPDGKAALTATLQIRPKPQAPVAPPSMLVGVQPTASGLDWRNLRRMPVSRSPEMALFSQKETGGPVRLIIPGNQKPN